jgi:hypothetical protein
MEAETVSKTLDWKLYTYMNNNTRRLYCVHYCTHKSPLTISDDDDNSYIPKYCFINQFKAAYSQGPFC